MRTAPLLLALLALAPRGAAQEVERGQLMLTLKPQLDAELLEWMGDLAEIAATGIGRHDTRWKVFHGCWDWHSAVHSHWTLIRYARATGDRRWDENVKKSLLRKGGLEAESKLLADHRSFEMPYGRAWFLRLVIDYELHFGTSELRRLGNEVMGSMLGHYREDDERPLRAHPGDLEYANASWAYMQMLAYARHIEAADTEKRLLQQIERRFGDDDAGEIGFAQDAHPRAGFFSRFGNWIALMVDSRTGTELKEILAPISERESFDLAPVDPLHSDHHLGMNPSRAWALAALGRTTGEERYTQAWHEHVAAMRSAHEKHSGDYRAYDHWVPSFCVYALTEPLE